MKKIIALMFCIIFLIGLASAEVFTFDNKVIYEENNLLNVEIRNTLGFETLGTLELKSHTLEELETGIKVGYGDYQLTLIYELSDWELYENGLGNVYFTEEGENIEKLHYFVEWKEVTEEIPVYTKGLGTLNKNGTLIYDTQVSYKTESSWKWVRYNSRDIPDTKTGKTLIGLMVYVEKDDKFTDAVLTFAGKRIKKHAGWNTDIAVDINSWWTFDGNFGIGLLDDFYAKYNGTNFGTTNITGILGSSRDYISTDPDRIDFPNYPVPEGDWTLSMWVFGSSTTGNMYPTAWGSNDIIQITSGNFYFALFVSIFSPMSINTWTHFVFAFDNDAPLLKLYKDGVLVDSGAFTGFSESSGTFRLGNRNDLTKAYDGLLDEIGIWNRTLSLTEVQELFNGSVTDGPIQPIPLGPADNPPSVILNSPVNNFNSSISTITFNTTVTDDWLVQNVSLFIDGIIDQTNTSNFNGTYIFTKSLSNGLHNWSILAFDNSSQINQSETRIVNITVISPTITLFEPIDNLQTIQIFINFTGEVTDNFDIVNVSFFLNGVLNETNSSGLKDVNYSFNKTLVQGDYTWFYRAFDNDSNPTDSATRSFTVHLNEPNITIFSPVGQEDYIKLGDSFTLNWSITEVGVNVSAHIINCSYIYNSIETFLNINTCLQINTTEVPYINGENSIYMNVTDIFNLSKFVSSEFSFKVVEINQSFENSTTEGNLEDYFSFIKLDSSVSITNVFFTYDEVISSADSSSIGDNTRLEKIGFTIPSVSSDENKTFFWNVTLNDSSNINLSSQNQTVLNLVFGNCSTYNYVLFNVTLIDEETQERISRINGSSNGTIEVNIRFMNRLRTVFLFNWTEIKQNNFTTSLCSSLPLTPTSFYSIDGVIKYFVDGSNAVEYYNLLNFSMFQGNAFQNITLFDLNLTDSTDFQLTFKDASSQPQENILIYVYREYIPEDEFKVVEIPKTDTDGRTIVHLVRNDVVYNFVAIDIEGKTVGVLNNVIAFCKDFTIGQCTVDFIGISTEQDLYNELDDVGILYNLNFDNSTNIVVLNFLSSTNTIKTVTLEAIASAIVTNRTICNETLSAITGTINCDVSAYVNTTSAVTVNLYVDGLFKVREELSFLQSTFDLKGLIFFGFLLILIMGIAFIESKEGVVISVILSVIALVSLGVVKGKTIGIVSSVIWLIIGGIILLIKLRKDD